MGQVGVGTTIVAALLALAACSSSRDDGATDATASEVPTRSSSAPSEPVEGGGGEAPSTAPPEVGAVLLGTAVATVSGGDDPREQSGDVERRGQECRGVGTLEGLAAGAPVIVRDAASSEEIGRGVVESTSALQISDSDEGDPPVWDCSFHFRLQLTAPATDVAVQIADLPELFGTVADGSLELVVPNDVTTPKPPPSIPEGTLPQGSVPELSLPEY